VDPAADRDPAQAGQAVRRLGVGHRDVVHALELDVGLLRGLAEDHEVAAQVRGDVADRRDQGGRRDHAQEALVEVQPQLVLGRGRPARLAGPGKARDHPAELVQCVALWCVADALLEGGPVGQAVLTGDGDLGFVQAGELTRGEAALGLELEVAKTRPARQRTRPTGHGSPSLTPGVRSLRAGKTRRRSQS
jgi:hypothetical protein